MLKIDVIKEISKKSQQEVGNNNVIVDQVKLLLESNAAEERDILRKSGLDFHIKTAENLQGEAIEKKEFFEKYETLLTEKEVHALCLKYYLKCLPVKYYKGNIGPNVGADIKRFVEKHKLQSELNSGNFQKCLSIIAPVGSFKLEKRPKDPVLVYNPHTYLRDKEPIFIPVAKWGEDFTVLRTIYGLFNSIILRIYLAITGISILASVFSNTPFSTGVITFLSLTATFFVVFFFLIGEWDEYIEFLTDKKEDTPMKPFSNFKN